MITLKKFIPGIAWFFLVLILICLPGNQLPKPANWLDSIFFDKWVHAGLFGILAFLFMLPYMHSSLVKKEKLQIFIKAALAVSIWGLATEFIQKFFVPFRAFDLWDWAADSAGAMLAYTICNIKLKRQTR
jgi:VanZ family protein